MTRRQKRHGVYDDGSDPALRLRHLIERDCRLAEYVRRQAEALSLPVHEVDGSQSPANMTELVERHFAPYLIAWFKRAQGG